MAEAAPASPSRTRLGPGDLRPGRDRARPAGAGWRAFVASLVPLYFGRVAALVIENRDITTDRAEESVERQAREFERLKPYLLDRWGAPARGPTAESRAAAAEPDRHPGGEPRHRGGADPARCRPARPAGRRAHRARDRRGARGDAALRGRDRGPARPAAAPAGPRLRARGHADPPDRPDRAARRRGDRRGRGGARGRPHRVRLGRQGARRAARRRPDLPFSATIDEVLRESPCDIAVVKQRGVSDLKRVVVPVRGGPHAELALHVADAIANATTRPWPCSTSCRRDHARRPGPGRARPRVVRAAARRRQGRHARRARPRTSAAILREADRSDIVVMGAAAPTGADGTTRTCSGRCPRRSPPARRRPWSS